MSFPSLVPDLQPGLEGNTLYFVMCDYGPKFDRAFVETDLTIFRDIVEGQIH